MMRLEKLISSVSEHVGKLPKHGTGVPPPPPVPENLEDIPEYLKEVGKYNTSIKRDMEALRNPYMREVTENLRRKHRGKQP